MICSTPYSCRPRLWPSSSLCSSTTHWTTRTAPRSAGCLGGPSSEPSKETLATRSSTLFLSTSTDSSLHHDPPYQCFDRSPPSPCLLFFHLFQPSLLAWVIYSALVNQIALNSITFLFLSCVFWSNQSSTKFNSNITQKNQQIINMNIKTIDDDQQSNIHATHRFCLLKRHNLPEMKNSWNGRVQWVRGHLMDEAIKIQNNSLKVHELEHIVLLFHYFAFFKRLRRRYAWMFPFSLVSNIAHGIRCHVNFKSQMQEDTWKDLLPHPFCWDEAACPTNSLKLHVLLWTLRRGSCIFIWVSAHIRRKWIPGDHKAVIPWLKGKSFMSTISVTSKLKKEPQRS